MRKVPPSVRGIRRLEVFLLLFQGSLTLVLMGVWSHPAAPRDLLPALVCAILLLLLCRLTNPVNPWVRGFCEWGYLYPFILVSYLATGKLIPLINPVGQTHDVLLAAIDGTLFRVSPALWRSGINHPLIVELCAYGYISYFLFGLLLIVSLYRRYDASTKVFAAVFSAVVVAFYLSYLGYWIYPAQGPRYLWKEFLDPLTGYALARCAFNEMDGVSYGFYDAFPSEHTMFSIVAGYYWFRYSRRMFWFMTPLLLLAVSATIILRYHWVTDVVAGAILAPLVILASNRFGPWLVLPMSWKQKKD